MPEQAEGIVFPIEFVFNKAMDAQKVVDGVRDKLSKANQKIEDAANKADKYGMKMMRVGMAFREFGGLFNSPMLTQLGQFTSGVGGLVDSMGDLVKMANRLKSMGGIGKALGIGGAVLGGVGVGAGIYDATFGKWQGNTSGNIADQFGKWASAGFNEDQLRRNMAPELNQITFSIKEAEIKAEMAKVEYKNSLKDMNDKNVFNQLLINGLSTLVTGNTGYFGRALSAGQELQNRAGIDIGKFTNNLTGYANSRRQSMLTQMGALKDVQEGTRAAGYRRDYNLTAIENEVGKRRTQIAKSYADDLLKMDTAYYKQREELSKRYGLEAQRMEQAHQKDISRMQEDHSDRLKKLAESRDALAIEDEIEQYGKERQRSEQDYQDAARQRQEDFANQLAEMEQAHQEQRSERKHAYNDQLIELKQYQQERRAMEMKEYALMIAEIMAQYQQALAEIRGAGGVTNNTTTTNNKTANVSIDVGVEKYKDIKNAVHEALAEAFS